VLTPPDPLQMDAGAEGELLVARVRTLLIGFLLPLPVISLVLDTDLAAGIVGLATVLVAFGLAVLAQVLLRRDFYRPWLGAATSLLDVTLVSAALGVFLLLGQPITTTNSRLLFEIYFLAIGATALRYDARVTLLAGIMAILQYGVMVGLAWSAYDLYDPRLELRGYGEFEWATQVARLLLLGVATLLALAIVLRSQRLRRASRSDRLTGLPNRSWFDERILAELSRARRYREPVALAMLDIDHFKVFNDTWGHAAGDYALRAVASAIQGAVRLSDMVVRYGGEEFVVLLPGMDGPAAVERVEAIRRQVEALPIVLPRRPEELHITLSGGVAVYGADGVEVEELLDRADERLFEAKSAGRNRVHGPRTSLDPTRPVSPAAGTS
jgi:diguanylate cyclase (GGDEF)-like protein